MDEVTQARRLSEGDTVAVVLWLPVEEIETGADGSPVLHFDGGIRLRPEPYDEFVVRRTPEPDPVREDIQLAEVLLARTLTLLADRRRQVSGDSPERDVLWDALGDAKTATVHAGACLYKLREAVR